MATKAATREEILKTGDKLHQEWKFAAKQLRISRRLQRTQGKSSITDKSLGQQELGVTIKYMRLQGFSMAAEIVIPDRNSPDHPWLGR
jgi:hypothetical protein